MNEMAMPERELETLKRWWNRIQYWSPPWAWRSDPYLEGITEQEFTYLRNLDEEPTQLPAQEK